MKTRTDFLKVQNVKSEVVFEVRKRMSMPNHVFETWLYGACKCILKGIYKKKTVKTRTG